MNMSIFAVNWLGLAGGIIWSVVLGMIWYSPRVFFPMWQKAEGITDEDMKNANPAKSMIFGLIANSFSVYVMGIVLNLTGVSSVLGGLAVSSLVSLGLITAAEINNGAFRMTKAVVFLIDGGYRLLMMAGAGILLSV
ncbi:MAG: DUF1761 domain-containing protein [Spirochaetales bacterium]|nr:DUF1761 domain-containing protein [Spirochaetales bacterium]